MPRVELRGHQIHYQQLGQGPDVLLIHGLFCNIAFWWFHVAPRLAETSRVTALDLRGHGFSGMPEAGYRAIDLADDVRALMDYLQIPSAHVIGHSFGGAVALALAALHPGRVARLTLADVWVPSLQQLAPLGGGPGWPVLRRRLAARGIVVDARMPRVAQALYEELLGEDDEATAEAASADFSEVGQQVNLTVPGGFDATAGSVRPALLRGALQFGPGPDGRPTRTMRRWQMLMHQTAARRELHDPTGLEPEHLSRIVPPTDIVYGERSRYRPSGEALRRLLPVTRTINVPNTGHFFPLLHPEALIDAASAPAALPGAASHGSETLA